MQTGLPESHELQLTIKFKIAFACTHRDHCSIQKKKHITVAKCKVKQDWMRRELTS